MAMQKLLPLCLAMQTFVLLSSFLIRNVKKPMGAVGMCLQSGDILEYYLEGDEAKTGLGVVTEDGSSIWPLCRREGEPEVEGQIILFYNEAKTELLLESVRVHRRLEDATWYLTNRAIELGPSNPHGEHAEEAFVIEDVSILDETVVIPFDSGH